MNNIYLSLGSNLGDRLVFLQRAAELLTARGVRIVRASSIYETEPIDIETSDWFLNQALEVKTDLGPRELLEICEEIERELGRTEKALVTARTIDIDILVYGDREINESDLVVPHPRMKERRFVLVPLAEIAPEVEGLLNVCQDSAHVKLYEPPTS